MAERVEAGSFRKAVMAPAGTRDEFIDRWADRITPSDGKGVVQVVRQFIDDLDRVIANERSKERRNAARKKDPQEAIPGT